MTATPKAIIHARHRAKRKAEGKRLLRIWVPVEREAEIKAVVYAMLDAEAQ